MRRPFEFKQFIIEQHRAAMPVTTDACVFGAAVDSDAEKWLDIGTGTGLLTLMLAQKFGKSEFLAIEPDEDSFRQAQDNFQNSQWKNRISIERVSLQEMNQQLRFDGIICNPPFFENSLESVDSRKKMARHSATLPHAELMAVCSKLLEPGGTFWLLIPHRYTPDIREMAKSHGLQTVKLINVRSHKNQVPHVVIMAFASGDAYEENDIVIYDEKGTYTIDTAELLKPFYLAL